MKRWSQPEQNARERRHGQREEQNRSVERNLRLIGDRVGRHETQNGLQSSGCEGHARDAAGNRQEETFAEFHRFRFLLPQRVLLKSA